MARIIGGVAASHTPTIGFAYDQNKQNDPSWGTDLRGVQAGRGLVQGEEARRSRLRLQRPRHLVLLRPLLGVHARHRRGVPGRGRGRQPPRPARDQGDPKLAAHIATSLVTDEFDLSYFQGKPLDHGFFSPMSVLLDRPDGQWPTKIVPLQVGVLQFPIPTAAPLLQAGQGAAPGHRELPRGHRRGRGGHRRALPPGARRGRGLQQPGVGPQVPRRDHRRPDRAHPDDPRRVRQARRP